MYRQFNIQQFYVLPTQGIYVFCVDLRTNSDYFSLQLSLIGFYNRGRECLLCSTDWVFKLDGYSFILKELILTMILQYVAA